MDILVIVLFAILWLGFIFCLFPWCIYKVCAWSERFEKIKWAPPLLFALSSTILLSIFWVISYVPISIGINSDFLNQYDTHIQELKKYENASSDTVQIALAMETLRLNRELAKRQEAIRKIPLLGAGNERILTLPEIKIEGETQKPPLDK